MTTLTLDYAQQLIHNSIALASQHGQSIAVAVVDDHGELLAFARMDNTAYHAGILAQNKAYTSARDRQPTANLAAWAQATGKDMGYWTDARFTGIQGGLPILKDNNVVGAIGISGLSEEEDAALAQIALDSLVKN
ncbi:heme-binding protein [Reinekea sp. G2M2-21]|uniref:GlcG/HbpS family heme-binding protein n=1 Tax=Reinekea sp. G2M2-21 TaxID=2788942 RepID=UPI0018AC669A|nr:heme-binding protein [Reinekea sp. G2M2-21]